MKFWPTCFFLIALGGASLAFPAGNCDDCHPDVKEQYENSVHGRARLKSGLIVAPACRNCHLAHSQPNKTEIPNICGKCHTGILAEYRQSIHGKDLLNNQNLDAPSCTDCHGVHVIAEASRPEAKVSQKNVIKTCSACHAVEIVMAKYGVKTAPVETYRESFHGKANLYGQLTVANCSSCHGIHNIRRVDDPASQVSLKNLAGTCGQCHPGALNNPNFSNVLMHVKPSQKVEPIVYYIRIFYIILIALIITGMISHNLLDLYRRWQAGRRK